MASLPNLSALALHSEPAPTGMRGPRSTWNRRTEPRRSKRRAVTDPDRSPSPDRRNIKWKDSDGRTLLHLAVSQRDAAEVDDLLSRRKAGLDLEARAFGQTALHFAVVHYRQVSIVRMLLEAGADVLAVTPKDRTVLHLAVSAASGEGEQALEMVRVVAEAFVAAGGDVSAKNALGNTALHVAVRHPENLPLVKMLVDDYGANIYAGRGTEARTPYYWATWLSERTMHNDDPKGDEKKFDAIAAFLDKKADEKRGGPLPPQISASP